MNFIIALIDEELGFEGSLGGGLLPVLFRAACGDDGGLGLLDGDGRGGRWFWSLSSFTNKDGCCLLLLLLLLSKNNRLLPVRFTRGRGAIGGGTLRMTLSSGRGAIFIRELIRG